MVIFALTSLWILIFLFIAVHLGRTPKGRGWLRIIWHNRKIPASLAFAFVCIVSISLVYIFHPVHTSSKIESRPIFEGYAQSLILGLEEQGVIIIDSTCDLTAPQPELAYVLPSILGIYNDIVQKPTTPRLVELGDMLIIYFDGYKQFKNRGINIVKGIQKKLGHRYIVQIINGEINHELRVMYRGRPWDNEQFLSLPAMEASRRENVDPALLMSIIRHTSSFDFNYQGNKRERGILALDSGYGLEQVYIGAHKLHLALDANSSTEDAVASLYPIRDIKGINSEWRKSALKSSWVKEVLNDVQFYRNNGLKQPSVK